MTPLDYGAAHRHRLIADCQDRPFSQPVPLAWWAVSALFSLACWWVFLSHVWPVSASCPYENGTDSYYELCVYGPWPDDATQDEMDTLTRQERN